MEMGLDSPDLPIGMVSELHLKRCKLLCFPLCCNLSSFIAFETKKITIKITGEEALLDFIEREKSIKESGQKVEALWSDFSQKWFTLMHSTRPFIFRDYQELADYVSMNCYIGHLVNDCSLLLLLTCGLVHLGCSRVGNCSRYYRCFESYRRYEWFYP